MRVAVFLHLVFVAVLLPMPLGADDDPPALNPFAPKSAKRDDARPGYVEMSDGTIYPGSLYLTRDARLKIYDEKLQRHREIPLRAIETIVAKVEKEWMEREWRFKENANDEKVYTGRQYPARQYGYEVTLLDERTISGSISGIIYVKSLEDAKAKPRKFLLHKRDKGPVGSKLESLVYLRTVKLGDDAMRSGQQRQSRQSSNRRGS